MVRPQVAQVLAAGSGARLGSGRRFARTAGRMRLARRRPRRFSTARQSQIAALRLHRHDRSMTTAVPPLPELFQAHRQGLAGAVRSVLGPTADVPEVLQDAFLKCWRQWQQGRRPNDPVAWIFVITWNAAVDVRRRRQRRPDPEPFDETTAVTTSTHPSPSHALEQREAVAAAQAAIARLADPEQQVFLLRTAGDLSFEAIAAELAIPVGTAKTRMRAALAKLRTTLGVTPCKPESPR
jgi:RNA polymerase sigma-70 factor (ECF subfamily)